MWDSAVFDLRLRDEDCAVVEVEVDDALPDAVVLIRVFHDRFLEVTLEAQHCAIIL